MSTLTRKPRRQRKVTDPLVGKWFHSFPPCRRCGKPRVQWQGRIVAVLVNGSYLVETYSWIDGSLYSKELVRLERIEQEQWGFYDTNEQMVNLYDHNVQYLHNNRDCDRGELPEGSS